MILFALLNNTIKFYHTWNTNIFNFFLLTSLQVALRWTPSHYAPVPTSRVIPKLPPSPHISHLTQLTIWIWRSSMLWWIRHALKGSISINWNRTRRTTCHYSMVQCKEKISHFCRTCNPYIYNPTLSYLGSVFIYFWTLLPKSVAIMSHCMTLKVQ